jgi:hypothetical protein
MKIHHHHIPYHYGDSIKIKPIFDVHFGNRYCDKQRLKQFLEDSDERTYFFGGGDLMDSVIVTDPRYLKSVDDSEGDAIIDEQVEGLHQYLEPYKDRIIGLGRGNHEQVIIKRCGTDPMKRLCGKLGCEYLGYSGMIVLKFRDNGGRGRTVKIRWHHGWGGGSRTQGADLTKFSNDVKHWDADIYLYGHTHRKQADRIPRLGIAGSKLISRPKIVGICGTFLKTYTATTDSTYSEEKGYPPVEIGGLAITIKPTNTWVDMWVDT